MFSFILPLVIVVAVLSGFETANPERTTLGDSLQAKATEAASEITETPEIHISITDQIPTKRITEFKGLISVSQSSVSDFPEEAISELKREAHFIGADGIINFRIVAVSSPLPPRLFVLYGNAVNVE